VFPVGKRQTVIENVNGLRQSAIKMETSRQVHQHKISHHPFIGFINKGADATGTMAPTGLRLLKLRVKTFSPYRLSTKIK